MKPLIKHIPDFLDYCDIERGLATLTQENYRQYLKVFEGWLKENKRERITPKELTTRDIWNYRLYLSRSYKDPQQGRPLARITQHYYLVALRGLLNYFAKKDIESIPSSKVELPKDSREKTVKFLELNHIKKLLESPNAKSRQGLRDRAIMESLFSTGLRVAELAALNRQQIHFKDPEGLEISIVGKGGTVRSIYFSARSLKWLKEYLKTRDDIEEPLFINYRSKRKDSIRLSVRSIENILKKYSALAGLPIDATPHTLRHSYATNLLTNGVDLRVVQEFLGHKNIATTQIYTHITNKRLKEIHKKFHGGDF